MNKNICLVTEELAGIHGSGGIGAAFSELAILLASSGHVVDVLYCPINDMDGEEKSLYVKEWAGKNIKLKVLNYETYIWNRTYEMKSYAVYQELKDTDYDFIHFHDYKALGFACVSAKKQGQSFLNTELVVQMHGPSCWTLDINQSLFSHEDQLKIDFMEREMTRKADRVVSPSEYLIEFLSSKKKFTFPENTRSIKNACGNLKAELGDRRKLTKTKTKTKTKINEIVLFARHEERKGIVQFCDSLDKLNDRLKKDDILVTFLGKFGSVNGKHSGLYLAERSKKWRFKFRILPNYHRNEAVKYLTSNDGSLVVMPSEENSPYTVFESLCMGKAILTSQDGGNKELIDKKYHSISLCDSKTSVGLVKGIENCLNSDVETPMLSESTEEIEAQWLNFHQEKSKESILPNKKPKVTLGITHYERPDKLIDAVISSIKQSYDNIEIVVIDDGSKKKETLESLSYVEALLNKVGGRLIRSENGYLGAARNKIADNTKSEYICFLDDDDIMKSDLIEKMVIAAESSKAEVINCLNQFMHISRRSEGIANTDNFNEKISYVPIGGPLSVGYSSNCLGSATALIKRDFFEKVGGYTELKGVGHEDYEFFLNVLQAGGRIEVLPEPLYLYEVGRPSMISSTSVIKNFKRINDAIAIDDNSDSIRDYIGLNIGKAAFEHQANSMRWQISQSPHAELIKEISDGGLTAESLKIKLEEYARDIGAHSFVTSLSDSTYDEKSRSFEFPILSENNAEDWSGIANSNSIIFEIKHELALKRYGKAYTLLRTYIDKFGCFDSTLASCISQMRFSENFGSEQAGDLYIKLSVCEQEVGQVDIMLALFNLSKIIGDDELKTKLITQYAADEEVKYFSLYPDVKSAVDQGVFPSGLSHYLKVGIKEGRIGYSYSKLCYM